MNFKNITEINESIVYKNGAWCVVHGHLQKKGSKRDKPIGTIIKCYKEKNAKNKAIRMHTAIKLSQLKKAGKIK